ncbi:MAG: aminopeptidase P N-terminal domain-containing protein [Bacilli bacterium]|nr:aminopeptidase P N-terminal domain-containing protein [Bacilli bacterium]
MEENLNRRNNFVELMDENSVAVLFAGAPKINSEDEYYPFQSNRHFFYLTNIEQENSILLIIKEVGRVKTYLFIDEYSELKEKWTGKRLTDQEAKALSNIETIYHTKDFDTIFDLALKKDNNQYGSISKLYLDFTPELKIKDNYYTLDMKKDVEEKYPHIVIDNVYPLVMKLRMVKSPFEIEQLRKAIHLTKLGINDLLTRLGNNQYEWELANDFAYYGMSHERHGLAFDTIAAAGKSAICLHYPQQTEKVRNDDLILFDLGFAHAGYSADVSRTYPVSGVFSPIQKKIYQSVLNCNKAVIEYAHAGLTIMDLQKFASEFLKNECVREGLLEEDEDIRTVYYHGVSHHLGLDTHDTSDRNIPLAPGNVITVEPGLYFKKYGIGVRIEDDILITDGASEVLTHEIKKEVKDIEELMRTLRR